MCELKAMEALSRSGARGSVRIVAVAQEDAAGHCHCPVASEVAVVQEDAAGHCHCPVASEVAVVQEDAEDHCHCPVAPDVALA